MIEFLHEEKRELTSSASKKVYLRSKQVSCCVAQGDYPCDCVSTVPRDSRVPEERDEEIDIEQYFISLHFSVELRHDDDRYSFLE